MSGLGIQYTGRPGFIYQAVPGFGPIEVPCRTVSQVWHGESDFLLIAVPPDMEINKASAAITVDSIPRPSDGLVLVVVVKVMWVSSVAWFSTVPIMDSPPSLRLRFLFEPDLTPHVPWLCFLHPHITEEVSLERMREIRFFNGRRRRYG